MIHPVRYQHLTRPVRSCRHQMMLQINPQNNSRIDLSAFHSYANHLRYFQESVGFKIILYRKAFELAGESF